MLYYNEILLRDRQVEIEIIKSNYIIIKLHEMYTFSMYIKLMIYFDAAES